MDNILAIVLVFGIMVFGTIIAGIFGMFNYNSTQKSENCTFSVSGTVDINHDFLKNLPIKNLQINSLSITAPCDNNIFSKFK